MKTSGNPSDEDRRKKEKTILQERLFIKGKKIPLTVSDVRRFLQLAGHSHRRFYQYTTLDSLEKMLMSGKVYLTLAADLNDRIECLAPCSGCWASDESHRLPDRTYMACFGYGGLESMEMWWLYGFNGSPDRNAVRLAFDGASLRQWAESFRIPRGGKREAAKFADGIGADPEGMPVCFSQMESSSFHDVLYRRKSRENADDGISHGGVLWADRFAPLSRISGIGTNPDGIFQKLPGFVKDAAWSGERETRLVVTLKRRIEGVHYLSVPFGPVLESLQEVLLGPTETDAEKENRRRCALCRLGRVALSKTIIRRFDWERLVKCSENSVRFKK